MLTSQGLVLATAMAVSAGTIFLFDHLREKYFPYTPQESGNRLAPLPGNQVLLKSCLSSSGREKREKEERKKNKKRRVRFSNDVKDTNGDGESYRRRKKSAEIQKSCCGNEIVEIRKMPQNRAALYSGILRDRVQRMEYSY